VVALLLLLPMLFKSSQIAETAPVADQPPAAPATAPPGTTIPPVPQAAAEPAAAPVPLVVPSTPVVPAATAAETKPEDKQDRQDSEDNKVTSKVAEEKPAALRPGRPAARGVRRPGLAATDSRPAGTPEEAEPAAVATPPAPPPAGIQGEGSEEVYWLTIRSIPSGADVLIDGQVEGKTPFVRRIFDPTRSYALSIRRPGFEPVERTLGSSDVWTKRGNVRTLTVVAKLTAASGPAATEPPPPVRTEPSAAPATSDPPPVAPPPVEPERKTNPFAEPPAPGGAQTNP
jgi:hypothetical protein